MAGDAALIISDITRTEADYLEIVCNFTEEEEAFFEMRLNGFSLDDCAEALNVSLPTAKRISRRVNRKITLEM